MGMDSSSTIKQWANAFLFIIVLVLFLYFLFWLFFLGGMYMLRSTFIKPVYELYPNTIWVSEDPKIILVITDSPYVTDDSYVVKDGETIPVHILVSNIEDRLIISNRYSRLILLEGTSLRVSDSKISFYVTKDFLYDNKYSTITFLRQNTGAD